MKPALTNRCSEGGFSGPMLNVNSGPNRSGVDAGNVGPLGYGKGSSSKLNEAAASPIPCLLTSGCPFAIGRLVVSEVISALNAVFRGWPLTHIGKKIFKSSPSFAQLNAATAIKFVVGIVLISAPAIDATPNVVNGCFASSVSNGDWSGIGIHYFGSMGGIHG